MLTRAKHPRLWLATAVLAAAGSIGAPAALAQQKVLRAAMHADVRTLDPFWTTQTIATIHGLMVYDTLFSSDHALNPQPQMVESWTVSPDRKVYTFKLRDGLIRSPGSRPFTTGKKIAFSGPVIFGPSVTRTPSYTPGSDSR